MNSMLSGMKVAVLVTDGFEQVELTDPKEALEASGAIVDILAPSDGSVRAWNRGEWGEYFKVDGLIFRVTASEYSGLLLPGGVINSDHLRLHKPAITLVSEFMVHRKPVAAICHAPWLLIEANSVFGRALTSYPSLRTDLQNAGARWTDREVVVDHSIVTSRRPADLDAFSAAFIGLLSRARDAVANPAKHRHD